MNQKNNDTRLRLGVCGASGRSGSLVVKVASEFSAFRLTSAMVSKNSKLLGHSVCDDDANVKYSADFDCASQNVDAWIDFSSAQGTVDLIEALTRKEQWVPLLIATTGHNQTQRAQIERYAKSAAVLLVSNTSLAVFAMQKAGQLLQQILGDQYQIEILEIHHKHKKDAPSGTALTLAQALSDSGRLAINADRRQGPRKADEIGIASLRGAEVIGEHTLYFMGASDRIELTHRSSERSVYARGALTLLEKLSARQAGLYNISDLY